MNIGQILFHYELMAMDAASCHTMTEQTKHICCECAQSRTCVCQVGHARDPCQTMNNISHRLCQRVGWMLQMSKTNPVTKSSHEIHRIKREGSIWTSAFYRNQKAQQHRTWMQLDLAKTPQHSKSMSWCWERVCDCTNRELYEVMSILLVLVCRY